MTVPGAPLAVPWDSSCADFGGLPPALRISRIVFVERWPLLHVCHLGSSVPQRAFDFVLMRKTMGVGPGGWVKKKLCVVWYCQAQQAPLVRSNSYAYPQCPVGLLGHHCSTSFVC